MVKSMPKTHLLFNEVLDLETLGLPGKILNDNTTEIYYQPYSSESQKIKDIQHKIFDIISYIYCEASTVGEEDASAYICTDLSGKQLKNVKKNKLGKLYSITNQPYIKCFVKRSHTILFAKISIITPNYPRDEEEVIWSAVGESISVPEKYKHFIPLVKATIKRTYDQDYKNQHFYEV